ncbi:organic cation transporter protein-like [Ornithodoros turicata]|uniref:organic cation transporter protein-like n=1 Tax=Ornithodoros turicata TaxID=34597 RepID=UPI00313882B4
MDFSLDWLSWVKSIPRRKRRRTSSSCNMDSVSSQHTDRPLKSILRTTSQESLPTYPAVSSECHRKAIEERHSTSSLSPVSHINDLNYVYGSSGPFQQHIFYVVFLGHFLSVVHRLLTFAFALETEHWCAMPSNANLSEEQWLAVAIPRSADGTVDRCHMYLPNGSVAPCSSWYYKRRAFTLTIQTEWNLVCDREWLVSLSDSVYVVGKLIAMPLVGNFSDSYGRQPVLFLNTLVVVASGFLLLIKRHLVCFMVCRFLLSFGISSLCTTGITVLAEITDVPQRTIYVLACLHARGLGYLVMLPIVLFLDNWFIAQLVVMVPTSFLIFSFATIPETPRWLLATGRIVGARDIAFKAAKRNCVEGTVARQRWEMMLVRLRQERQRTSDVLRSYAATTKYYPFTIFSVLLFNWLSSWILYYSLTPSAEAVRPTRTASVLADVLLEFFAFCLVVRTADKFGRIPCIAIGTLGAGLLSFLTFGLLSFHVSYVPKATLLFAKLLVTAATGVLYLHALETFPTLLRNTKFNACALCEALGAVTVSFGESITKGYSNKDLLCIVFSVICIVDGALVFCLPETLHKDMPDDYRDFERLLREPQQTM